MALICDTGPLSAAMDRADQDHDACARLLERTDEQLIVPSPVLVEVDWLAGQRLHPDAFLSFLADIDAGRLGIVDVEMDDYRGSASCSTATAISRSASSTPPSSPLSSVSKKRSKPRSTIASSPWSGPGACQHSG